MEFDPFDLFMKDLSMQNVITICVHCFTSGNLCSMEFDPFDLFMNDLSM
jgi:hypothetical protein